MISRGNKKARQHFYVTNLGRDHIIFGYPWCRTFNPDINWTNAQLKGPKVQGETLLYGKFEHIKNFVKETKQKKEEEDFILENNRAECSPWSRVTLGATQGGRVEINKAHNAIEMAHQYAVEHGQQEVTLPEEFKRHAALFSDKEANKFPPS